MRILQINECLNLSTGKIAQHIGELIISKGWESWLVYSGREKTIPSKSNLIRVGNYLDACLHYAKQKMFDNEGLASVMHTKRLLAKIKEVSPDIIHIHNIHDHWLNYPLLLGFIVENRIPLVWTQHDCWAFTGGCMYFDMLECEQWKDGCNNCPDRRNIIKNQSSRNFKLKHEYLAKIENLTFVPVSDWLADLLKESTQKYRTITTIHNGTDLTIFSPRPKPVYDDKKFFILGVAAVWDERKGLDDFIKMRSILSSEYEIILVGLKKSQIKNLPKGIRGIERTANAQELAQLYSDAGVFVNATYSDNFPTTNIEALACGTPVITYRTGGSPEAVDELTGAIIEQGDLNALCEKIKEFKRLNFKQVHTSDCRMRAVEKFDKNKCFEKYIDLYQKILSVNPNKSCE